MKKILLLLIMLSSLLFSAKATAKKAGCILSQDGKVVINWQDKKGSKGTFDNVDFVALKKEGVNFKEVFVGSQIVVNSDAKPITLMITGVKSNPRVKPDPRTGTMTFMILEQPGKTVTLDFIYDKGKMNIKGKTDIYDFTMLDLNIKIKAILCNV